MKKTSAQFRKAAPKADSATVQQHIALLRNLVNATSGAAPKDNCFYFQTYDAQDKDKLVYSVNATFIDRSNGQAVPDTNNAVQGFRFEVQWHEATGALTLALQPPVDSNTYAIRNRESAKLTATHRDFAQLQADVRAIIFAVLPQCQAQIEANLVRENERSAAMYGWRSTKLPAL